MIRYLVQFLLALLLVVTGLTTVGAAPMGAAEIKFYQTENMLRPQDNNVGFAARAPPLAVTNVTITGIRSHNLSVPTWQTITF